VAYQISVNNALVAPCLRNYKMPVAVLGD